MKKLNIQSLSILINNKEKINILCLENKNEKYILYSDYDINEEEIDNNHFKKMEFSENMQITPKKKFNDLKLSINSDSQNNMHTLLLNNKNVFYLKNSKNIIINNHKLKLILYDGNLLVNNDLGEVKVEKKNNLVEDLLSKNSNNNLKNINFKDETHNHQNSSILEENSNFNKDLKIIEFNNNLDITDISKEIENMELNDINYEKEEHINNLIQDEISEIIEDNNIKMPIEMLNKEEILTNIILENVENKINDKAIDIENFKIPEHIENKINDIVTDISSFKIHENIPEINLLEENHKINEKIKTITKSINEEKIELNNKKNELDNEEVFNLENILSDFNKLFSFIETDKIENKNESEIIKPINTTLSTNSSFINKNILTNVNTQAHVNTSQNVNTNINRITPSNNSTITNKNNVSNTNTINVVNKNKFDDKKILESINKTLINNIPYIVSINYQNINYKIFTIKLNLSNDLNFSNVFKTKVCEDNIINKFNLAFELEKDNSSYLFSIMNQKHLINKINNSIVLTNLSNRSSQIIKNKENFKIITLDYILLNDCTLIVPTINKKIFDNNYGTSYNLYVPRII